MKKLSLPSLDFPSAQRNTILVALALVVQGVTVLGGVLVLNRPPVEGTPVELAVAQPESEPARETDIAAQSGQPLLLAGPVRGIAAVGDPLAVKTSGGTWLQPLPGETLGGAPGAMLPGVVTTREEGAVMDTAPLQPEAQELSAVEEQPAVRESASLQDPRAVREQRARIASADRAAVEPPEEAAGERLVATRGGRESMSRPGAEPIVVDPRAFGLRPAESEARPGSQQAVARQAPASTRTLRDESWLQAQNPERFTLQVQSGLSRIGLSRYPGNPIFPSPIAAFEVKFLSEQKGNRRFAIVVGDYDDRASARASAAELSRRIPGMKPWIRRFGEIQTQLGS